MTPPDQAPGAAADPAWQRASLAAALFAVDPPGLAGIVLRARPGPVRDDWLALLRDLLPAGAPFRRVPLGVTDDRLLGGLDLPATLAAGRPRLQRGLLAEADGGVVLLGMAERLTPGTAARIALVLDSGALAVERDGFATSAPARLGVVALDEGIDDEQPPACLLERLAFRLDLASVAPRGTGAGSVDCAAVDPTTVAAAHALLPRVRADDAILDTIGGVALSLGVWSLRGPWLCLRAARAHAALAGRVVVEQADVAAAAALVLGPRATIAPQAEAGEDEAPPPESGEAPNGGADPDAGHDRAAEPREALDDVVLAAALAALPPGLLAALAAGPGGAARSRHAGRAGAVQKATQRGRPVGARRGQPPRDGRLHLLETLRAAAPWQRLRHSPGGQAPGGRLRVLRDDFRVVRTRARAETTTMFVVDASGSAALQRLAEAKGAVETLLADCYARRDRVAVIAFRGQAAELLLPPTRSLVRAKRSLAGLPGGGGTPLAAGIEAAFLLADAARRRGETATVVLLTDGRANVALDGTPGRARAASDADAAARRCRAAGIACLLVDTSVQPHEAARRVAREMGARYLALPYADARAVSLAVRAAA